MKEKFILFYFDVAKRVAELSHAKRLKVGAVIVKDHRILSYGYNGTPSGFDNCCEFEVTEFQTEYGIGSKLVKTGELKTKPEVIHAEMNAIAKISYHGDSCKDATMFLTHSPCVECAKIILQSGISNVYYLEDYRSTAGVDLLKSSNSDIMVLKYEKNPLL